MANELRWGLLSTAHINRAVIPHLRNSPRNRLVTVASRTIDKARSYAAEWKIDNALGSYEELLADPEIDVIYNPLPNSMHAEWTVKALEAGKHVLCEKPLATTLADVDAIISAAKRTGKVVAEAFMYRHHPLTLKARELVASGEIGKIVMMRGVFTFNLTNMNDVRMNASLGGGSIWDIGCYPISYARSIYASEPVQVFGQQVASDTGVDESFSGEMLFPGNVLAQIQCSFNSPAYRHFEVYGDKGRLEISNPFTPSPKEKISLVQDGKVREIEINSGDLYAGEIEDMADVILDHKQPRISLSDSRNNVRTIIAMLESAAQWESGRLLIQSAFHFFYKEVNNRQKGLKVMKIGLQIPSFTWEGGAAKIGERLVEIGKTVDQAGFFSLWVMDHFFQIRGVGKVEEPMLESYSTMSYMAAVTSKVKLGTMVTGVVYRHPGILVKTVTTLDVLSGGRAYLGIGAAWNEDEFARSGSTFSTAQRAVRTT